MASSSAAGPSLPSGKLAELEQDLKDLKAQKAGELGKEIRDKVVLDELNKDLDRVQTAITALSVTGEDFSSS